MFVRMLPTNGYGSKSSSKQRMAMTVQNPTNKLGMKFGDSRKRVSWHWRSYGSKNQNQI
jgi:hypothetical protein